MRYHDIVNFWVNLKLDNNAYVLRVYDLSGVPTSEYEMPLLTAPNKDALNPDTICTLTDYSDVVSTYSMGQLASALEKVRQATYSFLEVPHKALASADAFIDQLMLEPTVELRSGRNYYLFLVISYGLIRGLLSRTRRVDMSITRVQKRRKQESELSGTVITTNKPIKRNGLYTCRAQEVKEVMLLSDLVRAEEYKGIDAKAYTLLPEYANMLACECLFFTDKDILYSSILLSPSEDKAKHEYYYKIERAYLPLLLAELREI